MIRLSNFSNRTQRVFHGILGCALLLFVGASSSTGDKEADPADLYQDAETDVRGDRFQLASEKLRNIKNKYPYSQFATRALLRLADVAFLQESYVEAAPAYETFRDLFPRHELSPYATFMIAESYFMDVPSTVSRDLASAGRSIDAYQAYLGRFSAGSLAPLAKLRIKELRGLLAKKEYEIGEFYRKQEKWESAHDRYLRVVNQYSDTEWLVLAKERVSEILNKHPFVPARQQKREEPTL